MIRISKHKCYIYNDCFEAIKKYEINIKSVCVSVYHTSIYVYKVYVCK